MPRYNMSSDEAGKLADFFAAAAGTEFPYSSPDAPASGFSPFGPEDLRPLQRYHAAMRILTDRKTYCAKCHLIGELGPGGEVGTVVAPDLEQVAGRLRPEYLRRWLAHPRAVLPYTPMPVNFPPDVPPLDAALWPGDTRQQLEAVRNLLSHYDWYLRQRTSAEELAAPAKEDAP